MNDSKKRRLLTVDDNQAIHADYRKVLGSPADDVDIDADEALLFGDSNPNSNSSLPQYDVDSAYQGEQAIEMVKQAIAEGRPYRTAFVDVRMPPGIDGVETASRIWKVDPDLPIVLCTAYTDHTWEEISERLGHSEHLLILKKPFDNVELRQMASSQTQKYVSTKRAASKLQRLQSMVNQQSDGATHTRDVMFFVLAKLAESRDKETGAHLERLKELTRILAHWLRRHGPYQDQLSGKIVRDLERASVLHDIGKVGTPDSVLLKPGQLTPEEFEVMKRHVDLGADALDQAAALADGCSFLKMAAEIARYHHEKFDGSGYPQGCRGQEIPLSARIVAVADVYDALTSVRVYKSAMTSDEARECINQQSGKHFDPVVVDAFNACWEQILEVTNPRSQIECLV